MLIQYFSPILMKEEVIRTLNPSNIDTIVYSHITEPNRSVFLFIIQLLRHLSTFSAATKMDTANLGLVVY